MAESEEALQLKRRARRRLVGAIALVTFVVIILPLVLDKEPGPVGPPLSVQIPSQQSGGFSPRAAPAAPAADANKAQSAAPVAPAPARKAAPAAAKPAPDQKAKAPGKAEELRAKAALNDETWAVALDAFSDTKNVKQLRAKLSAAGIKFYTEPVDTGKGKLTRVRAGPFASKEAAENARAKLEAIGLKPGAVVSR
jgi:DedD protein